MPEPPGSQRVTLGEAILDLAQGTLTRQGEVVPLRSKSFRLLCELARQPGRVVPKSQLLDAVWPDVIVTEVSLNQAVRDIRKALGDEAGQILRTVVRRGFMLCPTDRPRPPKPDGLGPSGHLASRPRIALLPLVNRTGRAELGPILDGLVEEVTAGLARFRNLTVLARHSATFAAAEPGLSLTDLGARLRANYLVEGSAKLVGDHLVLAWALNDACSGEILWGESFPCEGSSWLTLQDLIPRRIVQRLFNSIEEAGHRSSLSRNAAQLSAFEHLARGRVVFRSYEEGANARALAEFAAAIQADPTLGVAYSLHGLADIALHGYALAPREVRLRARLQAGRGVELAPDDARCHSILSYVHGLLDEYELAEAEARRAVQLNPCDADALDYLALAVLVRGRPEEALERLGRAMDVNPLWPSHYDEILADAYFDLRRYEAAIQVMHRVPRLRARQEMQLAACHAYLGQPEAARRHVARARALAPDWDFVGKFRGEYNFESEDLRQHMIEGVKLALRMANDG